jgi:hypothetical protein
MERARSTADDSLVLDAPLGQPPRRYSTSTFLDDLGRLLTALGSDAANLPCTIPCVDGRLILLQAELLSDLPSDTRRVVFARKYGAEEGTTHGHLVQAVLDFLAASRAELVNVGLATDRGELAVREEFVEYLLSPEVSSPSGDIPTGAILRFLDEWGHRWT